MILEKINPTKDNLPYGVKASFFKQNTSSNKLSLCIYISSEICNKLHWKDRDLITFSVYPNNDRQWYLKKAKEDENGHILRINSQINYRLIITWSKFTPERKNIRPLKYQFVNCGLRIEYSEQEDGHD